MPNAIAFHSPGVTYNGLHGTTTPTSQQVIGDLTLTRAHFGYLLTYYPQYNGGAVDVGQITYDLGVKLLNSLFLFDGPPTGWKTTMFNFSNRQ